MKKITLSKQNLNPNFIGSWMLDSTLICDEMINYFENHTALQKSGSSGFKVDKEIKDSSDINLSPADINLPGNQVFKDYFKNLFKCYEDYLNQWPFLSQIAHDLECVPGAIIVKCYSSNGHAHAMYHRKAHASQPEKYFIPIDTGTGATLYQHAWNVISVGKKTHTWN